MRKTAVRAGGITKTWTPAGARLIKEPVQESTLTIVTKRKQLQAPFADRMTVPMQCPFFGSNKRTETTKSRPHAGMVRFGTQKNAART